MFRMRRLLKIFLEMNESARGLNEAFEKIVVIGIGVQPELLENIVRFIITLVVPALKKGAIEWVLFDIALGYIDIFRAQFRHKSRNPLAFVHEELNLQVALMMSKQAPIILFQQICHPPRTWEFTRPARLCYPR